jgi:hypothetical protein
MKILAATALAIILPIIPSSAHAQTALTPQMLVMPPFEYDYPYQGTLTVRRADKDLMTETCPKTAFPITLGCAESQAARGMRDCQCARRVSCTTRMPCRRVMRAADQRATAARYVASATSKSSTPATCSTMPVADVVPVAMQLLTG